MIWKYFALGFAWLCIVGALGMFMQIKDGFSKLEEGMGLMCGAAILFMFPILTDSIYMASETNNVQGHADDDAFVYLGDNCPVKLTKEQHKDRWKRFKERQEEDGRKAMPYEEWIALPGASVVLWEDLIQEQKIEYNKLKLDKDGEVILTNSNDEKEMGISAVVAVVLIGIFGYFIKFLHIIGVPYCILAPSLWLWYIVL